MIAEVGDMRERQRQQDGDAVGAAEAGQHADDDAEHDADDHHHQVERLEDDGEAVEQIDDLFHSVRILDYAYRSARQSAGPLPSETRETPRSALSAKAPGTIFRR